MTRDQVINDKELVFNYDLQCWIMNGRIVRCGHPESMNCDCYGKLHAGEVA